MLFTTVFSVPQAPTSGVAAFKCLVKGPTEEGNHIPINMKGIAPHTVMNNVFIKPDGRFLLLDTLYDDQNVFVNVFEGTSDSIDVLHQNRIISDFILSIEDGRVKFTKGVPVNGVEYECDSLSKVNVGEIFAEAMSGVLKGVPIN